MKISSWMKRAVLWLSCAAAALLPVAAQAQDKPIAVVSFAGYDALMNDLNYVGELAGRPELGKAVEGILSFVTRAQGLAGLDKTKPIGAAVSLTEGGQPAPLVFIPVTDVEKLLDALQGIVPNVEDIGDGFSKIRLPNGLPLVLKTTDGWAFLSTEQDHLKNLPKDPSKLLGNLHENYDLAVQINVKNVPEQFIQIALQQLRQGAAPGLQQKEGEDDAVYQQRKKFTESTLQQLEDAIQELDHFTVGFEVDEKDGGAFLDAEMIVKEGGKLAAQIVESKKGSKGSAFPGFADEEAVANFHFVSPVLADQKEPLLGLIKMAREQAAKKIDEDPKLADAAAKDKIKSMASDLFDVAEATVQGGRFNGGAVIYGEGPFELVAGGLIVDAKKLEKVFREAIELAGDKPGVPEVKFDAVKEGGVSYHTITVPVPDDKAQKVFGEEVTIAIGFGEKVVVLGVAEEDTAEAAAEVLADKEGADELPPAQLQVKVGPLVQFAVDSDDNAKPPLVKLAEALADSEDDHVTVTSDYIANGSRMRISIDEGLIEAIGKVLTALK